MSGTSILQPKLTVGSSNDPLEQEADRIADQLWAPSAPFEFSGIPPRIQRIGGEVCGHTDAAPASVDRVLDGTGRPLEPTLRQDMEQRFGHDFSRVRLHSGDAAEQSAREMNAEAYTVGHNIVFGAGRLAPATPLGRRLIAHELTHVVQQSGSRGTPDAQRNGKRSLVSPSAAPLILQRKCKDEIGKASDCKTSADSVIGWQFFFKEGCDDLLVGEDAKIANLKYGRKLKIHGFANQEGKGDFDARLACQRVGVIADLAAKTRPEAPVLGRFTHDPAPGAAKMAADKQDTNRSVIVEQIRPTREEWLDPTSILSKGWSLHNKAANSGAEDDLNAAAAHRAVIKSWLESIPKAVAPAGKELDRKDITDYSQLYSSAEFLWKSIDKVLANQGHAAAKTDTYVQWASGTGTDQGPDSHAKHVPSGAQYHVDLFGEGFFPGAINIGMADRTSTTGVSGSRVPTSIYRKFSSSNKAVNRLPIEDHVADLVTSENGPLMDAGLIDEIARITAPGGTIVLYGPDNMEKYHDQMAKAVGGTIKKYKSDGGIESVIAVPKKP